MKYVKVPLAEFENLINEYKKLLIVNEKLNDQIKEYNKKFTKKRKKNGKH